MELSSFKIQNHIIIKNTFISFSFLAIIAVYSHERYSLSGFFFDHFQSSIYFFLIFGESFGRDEFLIG